MFFFITFNRSEETIMATTPQESGKQGDGRSTSGTTGMGSQGGQGSSMGSQTGASQTGTGTAGSRTGSQGGSMGTQTGSRGSQSGSTGMHTSGTQTGSHEGKMQSWGNGESEAEQHTEGTVARTIEQQTAKLPSDLFLWAAVAAMGVSAAFEFTGHKDKSRFIGQWVAPFLL